MEASPKIINKSIDAVKRAKIYDILDTLEEVEALAHITRSRCESEIMAAIDPDIILSFESILHTVNTTYEKMMKAVGEVKRSLEKQVKPST